MLLRSPNRVIVTSIITAGLIAVDALGQGIPNVWVPVGVDDYSADGNWDATTVPTLAFEERAVISNGGTASLSVSSVPTVGGVDVTTGTLQIDRGGMLTTGIGSSANGTLTVGTGGNLVMGGLVGSGSATFSAAGAATLQGSVSLIGHNIDFSATSINLSGTLKPTITTSGYSALKTAGNAALSGPLQLTFSGVTPTGGDFWDVIDAASITGGFSQITSNTPLGQGLFLVYETLNGGANGTVGRVSVDAKLILSVDRQTGQMTIQNRTTSSSVVIDGYYIESPSGALVTGAWGSFNSNGFTTFRESNPSSKHLGELSLTGSRNIASNSNISLGESFAPPVTPPLTVTAGGDLAFSYHEAGGSTQTGIVDYVGAHNNLVLVVNPDGQVYLQNQSSVDLNIDGYFISSASGALNNAGWTSLAESDSAWRESNPSDIHLGELALTTSRFLGAQSDAVSLGSAFDVGGAKDLFFTYHRAGMGTLVGTVEYEDGVIEFESSIPGDYDKNGTVETADYTKWRQLFGTGNLDADGNNDTVVNAADYVIWRDHLGQMAGSGAASATGTAVPEPPLEICLLVGAILLWGRAVSRDTRDC